MTSDNKKDSSKKKTEIKEIEIEQKDLMNILFDKSSSQFESQLFLSRKRMLSAENGQNELSELLKSKLKALDMMLFILSNNKNILKESDLSCCEVLNNLLCISKKDKSYGEHIYSKIKSIILYIIKNQISIKEKNIESNKVILKFLITLFNIKFDNGYFKQALEIISTNQDLSKLFINELFDKIFKGRNITIKLKEMKYMIKTIILDNKIKKFMNYFDILENILSYAHEKESGGCRTSYQLNQVAFLLQYLIEILTIKEIKQSLPEKEELRNKLQKILNNFNISIKEFVDKKDFISDNNKMSKKEIQAKNEKIKRKKTFFTEMNNFLKKLQKYFEELEEEDFSKILGEINDLYKNVISTKYVVVIDTNKNDKHKIKKSKDKEQNQEKDKMDEEKDNNEKKEKEKNQDKKKENDKEEEIEEDKDDENDDVKKEKDGIELNEEKEENEEIKQEKKRKKKNKNSQIDNKQKINKNKKRKESKNKNDSKMDYKNKKKKEH